MVLVFLSVFFFLIISLLFFISDFKQLNLPCGDKFTISVRDDILDMEDVARIFEQEKDIVNEVQRQSTVATDMILLSKLYPLTEDETYDPHCKISFGLDMNKFEPTYNHKQCGSENLEASTVCSSSDSLSFINHVRLHSNDLGKTQSHDIWDLMMSFVIAGTW